MANLLIRISFIRKWRINILPGFRESLLRPIVDTRGFVGGIVAGVVEECLVLEELVRLKMFFTPARIVGIVSLLRTFYIISHLLSQEMVLTFKS